MVTFIKRENSVQINTEETKTVFPLGSLYAFAEDGDNQTVNIRLMGSRKNIYSFIYTDFEPKGNDAVETVELIGELLK